jgi:hypothetical protein
MGRKLKRYLAEGKVVPHHKLPPPDPTQDDDEPLHQTQQTQTTTPARSKRAQAKAERRRQNQITYAEAQLRANPNDRAAQERLKALQQSDGPLPPRRSAARGAPTNRRSRLPTHPDLLRKYKDDDWNLLENLRQTLIQRGLVEHRITPTEAIQRAIDDVTVDYLALRHYIDQRVDNPKEQQDHPLTDRLHYLREAMVRYSTFATQYRLAEQQQKVSEARTALLAFALKEVLTKLGLDEATIARAPKMLIETIASQANQTNGREHGRATRLDENKAEALLEILHHDSEVVILDEPIDGTARQVQHAE